MFNKLPHAFLFFLMYLMCSSAFVGSHIPSGSVGPPSNTRFIKSMVESSIGLPERTDVGIGESVSLWIEDSSHPSPDQTGQVIWTVTGHGATAYPIVSGEKIRLYIELSDSDGRIEITASMNDPITVVDEQLAELIHGLRK